MCCTTCNHSINIAAIAAVNGNLYKLAAPQLAKDLGEDDDVGGSGGGGSGGSGNENSLLYSLQDIPPWYISLFLGIQVSEIDKLI